MNVNRSSHPLVYALRSRDAGLFGRAAQLISEAHRYLEYASSSFPSGTDHTSAHTTTVERIAGMFLPDHFLADLTPYELFFLALACHYHDLGMVGTVGDDSSEEGRLATRDAHAVRIGERLAAEWKSLGFESAREAEILGEICRGHRPKRIEGVPTWDDIREVELIGPGDSIRTRLVAALIFAIDELHLGADRAPQRDEDWRQITDETSRRHWWHHRSISGPAARKDELLYQITPETPRMEEYLRAHVLRKALKAVEALKGVLVAEGISSQPLPIAIEWRRDRLWKLLFPLVAADLKEQTEDSLVVAVFAEYARMTRDGTDLASLCLDRSTQEVPLKDGIRTALKSALATGTLVRISTADSTLVLSSRPQMSQELFKRMREGDQVDELFVGRYRESWEKLLYRSAYGREYIKNTVYPAVERGFSIRLSLRPDTDPIRLILNESPSAALVAMTYQPLTRTVVKEDLLGQCVITGVFFDLYNSPEWLLDATFRKALWTACGPHDKEAKMLRFLEELALVGGFTSEQVATIMQVSEEAVKEIDSKASVSIRFTQTIPKDAPRSMTVLPWLVLAGHRAQQEVTISSEAGHNLVAQIDGSTKRPGPEAVQYLRFGPGPVSRPSHITMPGRLEVDELKGTLRVLLAKFSEDNAIKYPAVFRLPVPGLPQAEKFTGQASIGVRWHRLTIGDARQMSLVNKLLSRDGLRVEFVIESLNSLLASADLVKTDSWFDLSGEEQDVLDTLVGVADDELMPLFLPDGEVQSLKERPQNDRAAFWLEKRRAMEKLEVTALILELATAADDVVDEQFLSFTSGILFKLPKTGKQDGLPDQETLQQQWRAGTCAVQWTGFFEPDVISLAGKIREWGANPRELAFPLRFGPEDVSTPATRTFLSLTCEPAIESSWHRIRPVRFRLRPINRSESYDLEARYWESVGDSARAELAKEIRDRLATPIAKPIESEARKNAESSGGD